MQPNPESYSVGRRPMDVSDYIDILRRHRGWILGPAFAGLVISVVVAFLWPDTYVSDATIRIVPPAVPERYVPSNVNLQIGQRIAAMAQQVRSRSNLMDLINSYGLYPGKKGRVPDEDLIEAMQDDIAIQPVASLREGADGRAVTSAFRISFAYNNRYVAQKVVVQIVSRFVDESLRTRSSESVSTTDFLKEQLAASKSKLEDIENRLTQYKQRYSGKLPEQLASNLAQLNTLETRLSAATAAINRATQEKLLLENQLRATKDQLDTVSVARGDTVAEAAKNERLIQLERQILEMENALVGLRELYTDTHPDVRRSAAQLASLKKSRESLVQEEEKKTPAVAKKEPAVRTRR